MKINSDIERAELIEGIMVQHDIYANKGGSFWVLLVNEKKIGKADLHLHKRYAELKRIKIEDEYRGHGIGTAFLKHIINWCRKNNIIAITVHAASPISQERIDKGLSKGLTQEQLIKFYKKCGFKEQRGDWLHATLRKKPLFAGEDVFWKNSL